MLWVAVAGIFSWASYPLVRNGSSANVVATGSLCPPCSLGLLLLAVCPAQGKVRCRQTENTLSGIFFFQKKKKIRTFTQSFVWMSLHFVIFISIHKQLKKIDMYYWWPSTADLLPLSRCPIPNKSLTLQHRNNSNHWLEPAEDGGAPVVGFYLPPQ